MWPKPHELPWDQINFDPDDEIYLQPHSGNPDIDLTNVMDAVENFVHQNLLQQNNIGLGPAQRGRSQRVREHWCKHPPQPPKVGRQCDVQPGFCGENVTHNRWLRQLRRLVHLEKLLTREAISHNILDQAFRVWETIKNAQGFPGGFRSFWVQSSSLAGLEPTVLPKALPSSNVASQMRVCLKKNLGRLNLRCNRPELPEPDRPDEKILQKFIKI